jgi:hypothetical protein
MIGGVVLARAVQDHRLSDEIIRAFDKSSADRSLANPNVGRRSCDLEANKFRGWSAIWKLGLRYGATGDCPAGGLGESPLPN